MRKILIIILLFGAIALKAQNPLTFIATDSITYKCYLTGDWDKLIATGNQAIAENIDFKYLRQRMGYAYFIKGNYIASQKQYEKALEFDPYDEGTLEYLYYCALNTGDETNARFYAAKLPAGLQKKLHISALNPIASFDMEYNYKTSTLATRSDPTYLRAGVYSRLGYHLSLYQSFSYFKQTVDLARVTQPDYLAAVNLSLSPKTTFTLAYHYLNTSVDSYNYLGNLVYASLANRVNRFSFGINGSFFKYDIYTYKQAGVYAGVTLPGKPVIYFTSYLSGLNDELNTRFIFSQVAGARISKSIWAEGVVTLGNLQNYNDHGALYVYNSVDPTVFRAGITLYWYAGKHIILYGNYLYDTKQIEQTSNQYIQQSFLGGLIWKR